MFPRRIAVTVWPFILLFPGEIIFSSLFRLQRFVVPDPWIVLLGNLLFLLLSLLVQILCVKAWNSLAARNRWARSRTGALAGYAVATLLGSVVLLASGPILSAEASPTITFAIMLTLSRFLSVIVMALIVGQVSEGLANYRDLTGQVSARLLQTQRINALLESVQREVATDSARRLQRDVQDPLLSLMRQGQELSNEALADAVDDFIADHLRPLAHRMHPVSVRLGLVQALRSLNPQLLIDVSPAVERLDADGELLDEDVRLQLYRWVRSRIEDGRPARIALVMRRRSLEVSVHPTSRFAYLDAVQITAGLRSTAPGVITAPLRGQQSTLDDVVHGDVSDSEAAHRRPSVAVILTVPLPHVVGYAMLLAASSFSQIAILSETVTAGVVTAVLLSALSAVMMACAFSFLRPPGPTALGATRVVLQWLVIALAPAITMLMSVRVLGTAAVTSDPVGIILLRSAYRFFLPGLALVVAHGLQVVSQRALDRANEALRIEGERQREILAESRLLDRDVAEALHRTVQGRLAAAVVLLRLGDRDEAWRQVVSMAHDEVPALMSRLAAVSGGSAALLLEAPTGLQVVERIDLGAISDELIADLRRAVSEIAVNAVRHGGATRLEVDARTVGDAYRLECSDDGSGFVGSTSPGLGSRLLDEVAERWHGSWRMQSTPGGCLVVMDLAPESLRSGPEFATR